VAALLSLFINKHGQKGDLHLNKCRAYPSGSKRRKKARGNNERGRSCSQVKKHSSDYFTVAVKSNGDIFEEPVRGQKIEKHVITEFDLRNDENRPSLTSSAVAEDRQDVSSKNTIDKIADPTTEGNDIGLRASGQSIYRKKCGMIG